MNIAEVVAQVARAAPSRPAVTTGGRTASYAAFWDRTRRIAGALRTTHRLRAGDRVALCMENCGEFFEALFACWTAGLCAVPANAKLHAKEVAFIAENAGARLLFTTAGLHGALSGLAGAVDGLDAVLCVEDQAYAAMARSDPAPVHQAAPEDDAWIFYTSGTTGRPKGATAHAPQPALHEPLLLRRHRPPRRNRHQAARRAAVPRLRPLRPAAPAAGRAPDRPRRLRSGGDLRQDPPPPERDAVRRADHGHAPRQQPRGGFGRHAQPQDALLRRRPDVRRRPRTRLGAVRAEALPVVRPGRVAHDHHRPVQAPARRCRASPLPRAPRLLRRGAHRRRLPRGGRCGA